MQTPSQVSSSSPVPSPKKKASSSTSSSSSSIHSDQFIAQQLSKRIKEKKGGVKVVAKKNKSTTPQTHEDNDYSDTESEPKSEYKKGGYHPVTIAERLGNDRYIVVEKLGWGYFSTVWLCFDLQEKVFRAVKIQKSAKDFTDAAHDEIKLLNTVMQKFRESCTHSEIVSSSATSSENVETNIVASQPKIDYSDLRIVGMFDSFLVRGVNGTHMCMAFEVMGANLLKLIEQFDFKGVPLDIVKIIMRDVLEGLDFLHTTCKVIHTDIKPENILIEQQSKKIKQIMGM